MGNLRRVLTVVQQKQLHLLGVVHDKLVEAVREQVAGLGIRAITNVGQEGGALETTTGTAINTLRLAPGGAGEAHEAVGLEPTELLGALLDNALGLCEGGDLGHG